VTHSVNIVIA